MIFTIAFREFRNLFASPSTWIILGILQFIFAWFFLARLDAFLQVQNQLAQILNAPGATQSVASPLMGTLALIMMMLVPIFSMRLIAEERRNQTLALLLAAPVATRDIVLGKFAGMMAFLAVIIIACLLLVSTLSMGTQLDFGLLLANVIGLLLLTASYTALGLYFSTLTAHPMMAAASTLATLFGLWLVDAAGSDSGRVLQMLSPTAHFQSFNNGLLLGADIAWFLLFCGCCLLLASRRLHNSRIYGL